MNCPYCRIPSMRTVSTAGEVEVDRCAACGAAWFDPGEIRELAEGRFAGEEAAEGKAPPPAVTAGERRSAMARAHREAAGISCPRCGGAVVAVDFQMTGVPVLRCRGCGGTLLPRASVTALAERFGFQRRNAALYGALGETMASEMRKRLERKYAAGPEGERRGEGKAPGLPVVVPFGDAAPPPSRLPLVTWALFGVTVATYLLSSTGAAGMG